MRRRIVTLAALTLSLSAIGIAPLTAQATSGATESGSTTITADLVNSVDVTIPAALLLSATFDPETAISGVDFTFPVAFNGAGYKVTFTSANPSAGAFQMVKSLTHYIPYTIVGGGGDNTASYASGTQGATLTDANADFKFGVAAITLSSALPSGAYTDSLTVLVTAV